MVGVAVFSAVADWADVGNAAADVVSSPVKVRLGDFFGDTDPLLRISLRRLCRAFRFGDFTVSDDDT